jgi:lipopolysaccharide export LptBFGC system permease protein LptF
MEASVRRVVIARMLGWLAVLCISLGLLLAAVLLVELPPDASILPDWGAQYPVLAVLLAVPICGGAVAITIARMESRGERMSLALSGASPFRIQAIALLLGLLVGGGQFLLCEAGLHLWGAVEALGWVFDGTSWLRLSDGLLISPDSDPSYLSAEVLERRRWLGKPLWADGETLRASGLDPSKVQLHSRISRFIACLFVALAASSDCERPWYHLAMVTLLAMGWTIADGLFQFSPLPWIYLRAWGATLLLAFAIGLRSYPGWMRM